MKIVLATGIYPPDIGGPATYVAGLEKELRARGDEVRVVTYGAGSGKRVAVCGDVIRVSKLGGPIVRWLRYAKALKKHARDADAIVAFSSVSVGIPLILSGIRKPEKVLRLGGDFFWERYTDGGGTLGLRDWYVSKSGFWRLLNTLVMVRILRSFDRLVYSTEFQRAIHLHAFKKFPPSTTEQNARPAGMQVAHMKHEPFRLLFLGRFVRFKNISSLIAAMGDLPQAVLTVAGEGPLNYELKELTRKLKLESRVHFRPSVWGEEKRKLFDEHDLLVLPSLTEISPNVALEARSVCLPVLLTEETGLMDMPDIFKKKLRTPGEIAEAVSDIIKRYVPPRYDPSVRTYANISDALLPRR